jgi:hypothetical protein
MEKGEILRTYSPVRVTLLALHDARALPDIPARGKHGICTARLAEIQPTRAAPRPPLVRTTPTRRASVGKEKTRKAQAPARAQPLADLAPKRSAHYKPNRTLAVTRRPRRPRPSCCRAFCLISSYYNTTTTTTGWMDGWTDVPDPPRPWGCAGSRAMRILATTGRGIAGAARDRRPLGRTRRGLCI